MTDWVSENEEEKMIPRLSSRVWIMCKHRSKGFSGHNLVLKIMGVEAIAGGREMGMSLPVEEFTLGEERGKEHICVFPWGAHSFATLSPCVVSD